MKNKKILAIGLCGAICLSIAGVTYASALASDTPKVSTSETVSYTHLTLPTT